MVATADFTNFTMDLNELDKRTQFPGVVVRAKVNAYEGKQRLELVLYDYEADSFERTGFNVVSPKSFGWSNSTNKLFLERLRDNCGTIVSGALRKDGSGIFDCNLVGQTFIWKPETVTTTIRGQQNSQTVTVAAGKAETPAGIDVATLVARYEEIRAKQGTTTPSNRPASYTPPAYAAPAASYEMDDLVANLTGVMLSDLASVLFTNPWFAAHQDAVNGLNAGGLLDTLIAEGRVTITNGAIIPA